MTKINFITSNHGKADALRMCFKSHNLNIDVVACDLQIMEPQFDTVREVSLFKAQRAFEQIKAPVLVEDGGFCIPALSDFPGVYTKYILKSIGAGGILKLMDGIDDRKARFISYATYIDEFGQPHQFERKGGEIEIAGKMVDINSPFAWSELWKICYVHRYKKTLCELSKEEIYDYFNSEGSEGSLQCFADWYAKNIKTD